MADELQSLLDRINRDGIQKAEQEREALLSAARAEASELVAAAKAEAKSVLADAARDAELLVAKGNESLRQAARDALLCLRARLQERMAVVARACLQDALSGDDLAGIIGKLVTAYVEKGVGEVEVLLSARDQEAVAKRLLAELGKDLFAKVEIAPVAGIEGGFRLRLDGQQVTYDFSDEALAEVLCEFLNPRLAELVSGISDSSSESVG